MADFKEFKVKVTVDTKDGTQQIEQTIKSVKDYEKVLDDLNKKKTKPGISAEEIAAIDKSIQELGNDFKNAGNKVLLVNQDLEVTARNLKLLQKEQKTFGIGTDEYKRAADKIADFKEKLEGAKRTQLSFGEQLENASGPVGTFFSGLEKVKNSFISFNGALKASLIGFIVTAIGGIVAAFNNVEGSGKKLQPLLIGMEKIFGGIFNAIQPLVDTFMDLAMKALPAVTTGIGWVYSGFAALFSFVKNFALGYGKIIKGIFTFDAKSITEGFDQMKGSFGNAVQTFNETNDAFKAGTEKQTKTQKENADKQKEILQKKLDDQKEAIDKSIELEVNKANTNAKILEEELKKRDEIENKKWSLEHKGAKVSADTLELQKQARKKFIDDALKADDDFAKAQIAQHQEEYKKLLDDLQKVDKNRETANKKELQGLKQKLIDGKITQEQFDEETLKSNVKFAEQKLQDDKDAAYNKQAFLLVMNQAGLMDNDEYYAAALLAQQDFLTQQSDDEIAVTDATQAYTLDQKTKRIDFEKNFTETMKGLDEAYADATIKNQSAIADAFAFLGGAIQQFAGDSKEAAIIGLLIEKAAGVAQIILNSTSAAMQIRRAYSTQGPFLPIPAPFPIPNPAFIVEQGLKEKELQTNRIQTGIALGALALGVVQGITGINASFAQKEASKQQTQPKMAFGGILKGPTHAMGGITTPMGELEGGEYVVNRASTMMFRPALETINSLGGGAMDFNYANMGGQSQTPIFKTYVVASEMSSQQELDRIIKDRSKI
jgi:hypothetical protein